MEQFKKCLWKSLLWVAVLVCVTACSNDDENGIVGDANELIVGEWQSTWYEGYIIESGNREDWREAYEEDNFTFNADGSGRYECTESGSTDTYTFDWVIRDNRLILNEGTMEEEVYTLAALNSDEMTWELYEEEDGLVSYDKEVFRRIR